MDETGRGTPAAGDVPDDLDRLDDAALREVAYGRVDSETDRMRSDEAARILLSRKGNVGDDTRGEPGPSVHRSSTDSESPVADVPTRSAGTRALGGALLVTGLVAGTGIGVGVALGAEQFLEGLQPDSMAVFDREGTADEIAVASDRLGPGNGQARIIATIDDVQVYGMSTSANVWFAAGYIPSHVCVTATAPDTRFPIVSCVPELLFRERGIRGELSGVAADGLESAPELTRVITFDWGPRGEPAVDDRSSDFVVSSESE